MAIITGVEIDQIDLDTARLSWTGTADKRVWIALNGKWYYRNAEYSGTDRTADIPMKSDKPKCIEVHEVESEVTPEPIYTEPEYRPTIHWDAVTDAYKYSVHHREGATGTDETVSEVLETSKPQYETEPRSDLNIGTDGTWHFFRVTAKDTYGVESENIAEKESWLVDIPTAPESAEISGSNGTFTLTLTL